MKYSEIQEELSEEEIASQRRQRFFIILFFGIFFSLYYFILTEFLSHGGNTLFPLLVMGFIGFVAIIILVATFYSSFTRTKTIRKGTITYTDTHKPAYGNDEYYWYFGEKKISVPHYYFKRFTIGDTVQIEEAQGNITITAITTPSFHTTSETPITPETHRHSTALTIDYEDQLNSREKTKIWLHLLRHIAIAIIVFFVLKTFLTLALYFALPSLPWLGINGHTNTIVLIIAGCCCLLFFKSFFYYIADLYQNKKIVCFSDLRTIQRNKPVHRNGKTEYENATITITDGNVFTIPYPHHTNLEESMPIEIHFAPYSKTVFSIKTR